MVKWLLECRGPVVAFAAVMEQGRAGARELIGAVWALRRVVLRSGGRRGATRDGGRPSTFCIPHVQKVNQRARRSPRAATRPMQWCAAWSRRRSDGGGARRQPRTEAPTT
jgi:hypothetical protein